MTIYIVVETTTDKRLTPTQRFSIINAFREYHHAQQWINEISEEDHLGSGESIEEYFEERENVTVEREIEEVSVEPKTWKGQHNFYADRQV